MKYLPHLNWKRRNLWMHRSSREWAKWKHIQVSENNNKNIFVNWFLNPIWLTLTTLDISGNLASNAGIIWKTFMPKNKSEMINVDQ